MFTKQGMVLDVGAGGAWDDVHVRYTSIVYTNGIWYLYYTGNDGGTDRIGLATSTDSINFTKQGMVLDVGAGGAWDDKDVRYPSVQYRNGIWYLFYTASDGSTNRIGLATSTDSINFTKQGMVLDVGAGGAWDDAHVWRNEILYRNGIWYLFYTGSDGSTFRIGLATSTDGINFTKQGMVLDVGAGSAWDDVHVHRPAIVHHKGIWYLFYTGSDGAKNRMGLATSTDGINFTKQGMVLDVGAGGTWDDAQVHRHSVIHQKGIWYLYYTGSDGSKNRIGLATGTLNLLSFPLTVSKFQMNAATGNFPTWVARSINDNNTNTKGRAEAIGQYAEVDFGKVMAFKTFRHYGNSSNNGDGSWRIDYWNDDTKAWVTWVAGVSTRVASWSGWYPLATVESRKIRFICTALDTKLGALSYVNEVEMRF